MASKEATILFEEAFNAELADLGEDHPDTSEWAAAGKGKTKAKPNGEDGTWWRENGDAMVQAWIDWRKRSKWLIWTTPDGLPGIELPIETEVGGVPLKMYIDRVMISQPTRQLAIVDLKTGARTPESDLQLGFYRLGILKKYGVDVRLGAYWMARRGELSEVFDLTRFNEDLMAKWLTDFKRAVDAQIFLPHITFKCRACSMSRFCAAYGGSEAHKDPDAGVQSE